MDRKNAVCRTYSSLQVCSLLRFPNKNRNRERLRKHKDESVRSPCTMRCSCSIGTSRRRPDGAIPVLIDAIMKALHILLLRSYFKHNKRVGFRNFLATDARRRQNHRITRKALQHPFSSAFNILYDSKYDQSLITFCGLNHKTFLYLLYLFEQLYKTFSPYTFNGFIRIIQTRASF